MSWLRLANQTAVITGAGSGIGRAAALALAEQSCNLLLTDVHSENLKLVASECSKVMPNNNISVESIVCDVRDKVQVEQAIQKADLIASSTSAAATSPSFSVASILVNCAGITRDGRVTNLSNSDWDDVLDINLKGTFLMCKQFCEPNRATILLRGSDTTNSNKCTGGGSIINIGSIVSEYGNMGQVNYAASKGGVVGLTRSLAKEMALFSQKVANTIPNEKEGNPEIIPPAIRVNCIQPGEFNDFLSCYSTYSLCRLGSQEASRLFLWPPLLTHTFDIISCAYITITTGFIHTPMAHAVPDKILSQMKQRIALGRLGQAEDVANLVLFLASNARSGYITGEMMECSGMLRL